MTLFLSASLVIMFPNNYLFTNGTFKVGKFYFYSRVLFLTQNFIRSCVIRSSFFPTHSYMFFQWKTFQMRIQDFRFFIPPNFPLKEKHPSRSLRITPRGNPFRYDEAKLRVLRILHQLLNFVSIADYYLSLIINTRFCFSVPFLFQWSLPMSVQCIFY